MDVYVGLYVPNYTLPWPSPLCIGLRIYDLSTFYYSLWFRCASKNNLANSGLDNGRLAVSELRGTRTWPWARGTPQKNLYMMSTDTKMFARKS